MTVLRYAAIILHLCLAGCMANQIRADVSRQIQVFGVELFSGIDYREINGVKATEEPCLKGYDRSFDPLEITIGYGFDKKVRKIVTRNPVNSMFGISPGMSLATGKRLAKQAGLSEESIYRYRGKELSLTLLVDSKGIIFGIMVETID